MRQPNYRTIEHRPPSPRPLPLRSKPSFRMRLGLVKVSTVRLGCFGFLLFYAAIYALSVLFWGFWLMLAMGAWGPYHWSYAYVITRWGLLTPLVCG